MSRKFGVSTRWTFTLNVDFAALDAQIGCIPIQKNFGCPKNTTKIEDILGTTKTYTFLDPQKKSKRWTLTMKNAMSKTVLPVTLDRELKCWHCHRGFKENPLGCPIKHIRKTLETSYYSHGNKKEMKVVETSPDEDYYLTDGYICSWECLLGYAQDHRHLVEYRESVQLVYQMFRKCGGEGEISPRPSFKMLEEYGGLLTREEYYGHHDTYKNVSNKYIRLVPFGELYEVSSKF